MKKAATEAIEELRKAYDAGSVRILDKELKWLDTMSDQLESSS